MRTFLFATALLVTACTATQISAGAADASLIVTGLGPVITIAETAVPADATAIATAYGVIKASAAAIASAATPASSVVTDLEAAVATIAGDIPAGAIPAGDQAIIDAAVALLPAIVAEVQTIQASVGVVKSPAKLPAPKMTPAQARAVLGTK